mmetsp:Transcript_54902/g.66124  ORF Transcript_54902/g.66124 Transcript_54902/m.66124 type:complete len:153 (+) Transcript_54902:342-800(+)
MFSYPQEIQRGGGGGRGFPFFGVPFTKPQRRERKRGSFFPNWVLGGTVLWWEVVRYGACPQQTQTHKTTLQVGKRREKKEKQSSGVFFQNQIETGHLNSTCVWKLWYDYLSSHWRLFLLIKKNKDSVLKEIQNIHQLHCTLYTSNERNRQKP